jgi:hypothetical protein
VPAMLKHGFPLRANIELVPVQSVVTVSEVYLWGTFSASPLVFVSRLRSVILL